MIISKVTKNYGFTLSLGDTFLEKPHGGVSCLKVNYGALSKLHLCAPSNPAVVYI